MELINQLLENGYKINEVKKLTTKDIRLMMAAVTIEKEKETTLDKAFPFLFA